jgi:hypothetical protein
MGNDPFEQDVAGLFAAPPAFEDSHAFAAATLARLQAFQVMRQRVLMGIGVIAAIVAGLMAARSEVWAQIGAYDVTTTPLSVWCALAAVLAAGAWGLSRTSIAE